MLSLALAALFLLILVQVFFLFRVADVVRSRLRPFIPKRMGVVREMVAGLLFLVMVALVFGVYLFGPPYVTMQILAFALSIPASDLGKFLPIFLLISLFMLGACVKLWSKRFAFCGLTPGSTPTRQERRAG